MIQVIITPEAITTMGLQYVAKRTVSEINMQPESAYASLVFVEGISHVQVLNILETVMKRMDKAFSIVTGVPPDEIHEFTDDTEVRVRRLDAEMN